MKPVIRLASLGVLSTLTALLLAACGGNPTATPTQSPPTNTPSPTPTLAPGQTPTPATATPTPTVSSFDAEAYFRGKSIKMITGTSPGGGYDTILRIFGKVGPKHFPEGVKFIVQNLPGAGQLRGLQAVLTANPDGYTMGATHSRWFSQELLTGEVENLDFDTMILLGSPTYAENSNLFCADSSVAESWQDVIDNDIQLTTGQTAPGNSPGPEFLDLITEGTDRHYIDNVYGYGGSAEVMAAFDRGEINSIWGCGAELAGRLFPEWLEDGRLAPIFWWELPESDEWMEAIGYPDAEVPHIFDLPGLELTDLQKRAFNGFVAMTQLSRTFLLPPGTPPEVADYWRTKFEAVVTDPEFIEGMEIAGYGPDYGFASGPELEALLRDLAELPEEVVAILRDVLPQ